MKSQKVLSLIGLLLATMIVNQECTAQTPAPTAAPAPAATVAPAATAPAAVPSQPSAAATTAGKGVKGKVSFTGAAPAMSKLKREADPFCGKTVMNDETVTVNPNGTLKNVAIRVIKGAAPAVTPPATPAIVDQNNCMYRPRVTVAVVNQKVQILNSDPTMHNVHGYKETATAFNQAQMKGAKPIEKIFDAPGVVKFKCDVHPWMTGYVVVSDNEHLAVTGDTGEYTLPNLPAGAYTIEAWHEQFGVKTAEVTVVDGQMAAVDFTYGQ